LVSYKIFTNQPDAASISSSATDEDAPKISLPDPEFMTECLPKDPGIKETDKVAVRHEKQRIQNEQQQEIVDIAKQMERYNNKHQGEALDILTAQYRILIAKYDDCTKKPFTK
jgi:hypothetical protein